MCRALSIHRRRWRARVLVYTGSERSAEVGAEELLACWRGLHRSHVRHCIRVQLLSTEQQRDGPLLGAHSHLSRYMYDQALTLKNSHSFVDVIILMYLDHEDVQSVATLNSMQTSIKTSLVTEMSLLRSRDSFVLNNLLAFIDKLRLLSSEHRKLLTVLKEMPNMSQNEMFGLIE